MPSGALLAFGPCVLDTTKRSLMRDGEEVLLGARHLALLILFTSRPGEVLPKDVLIDTAWRGVAVTTNSLDQSHRHVAAHTGAPIRRAVHRDAGPSRLPVCSEGVAARPS